ncbi:MAG: YgeY family selenium metabolism-linked hydrolase [Acidobacteria bacterium]|nr:YgeY family selenium metabolism-linked hydrolase [Acidobacteriota bacterium]
MSHNTISHELESEILQLSESEMEACTRFLHDLITVPSPSGGERLACELVMREMEKLGFDEIVLDDMGNVLGRIGSGPRVIAFDAHVDTVGISNPSRWKVDPFKGVIENGILYGRGASDQKGGLAAIVHGAALAARAGRLDDVTLWVTATVSEEDCVGLAWQYLVRERDLHPEVVVIAMPSGLEVCRGQRGRMEVRVETRGVSAHGSQPDRGDNAIYSMMPIVFAVSRLHGELDIEHPMLGRGSIAVTRIRSRSASLTAIPDACTIDIDRRITIGETRQAALEQLEQLPEVRAAVASVELKQYAEPSWRGVTYPTDKFFPAWETSQESLAVAAALDTARHVLGREPKMHHSNFSSNGCATAGMFHIPTVGFGPGNEMYSHSVNDQIELAQLAPAMAFYALFPGVYLTSQRRA